MGLAGHPPCQTRRWRLAWRSLQVDVRLLAAKLVQQLVAGPAGSTVAELGSGLLALLGVGQHLGGTILAKDLLARVGAHKADKV